MSWQLDEAAASQAIPWELEGGHHEERIARAIELALVALRVQVPTQPDTQGTGRQAERQKSLSHDILYQIV
jgi:hypothetical protein